MPTSAERLASDGFTSDDTGLLAAVTSENWGTRALAYCTAYDLDKDVLVAAALHELETVEQLSGWPNFEAARYLDQRTRVEGTDYLRQLASTPLEELQQSHAVSEAMKAIEILTQRGEESFAPQITACLQQAPTVEAVAAARALAVFTNPAEPQVEQAWLAAARRLNTLAQSEDPNDQSGAWLYATWLSGSVQKQTIITERVKNAFDNIVVLRDRGERMTQVAAILDSARAHWATCELVPSEEPPPADPPE